MTLFFHNFFSLIMQYIRSIESCELSRARLKYETRHARYVFVLQSTLTSEVFQHCLMSAPIQHAYQWGERQAEWNYIPRPIDRNLRMWSMLIRKLTNDDWLRSLNKVLKDPLNRQIFKHLTHVFLQQEKKETRKTFKNILRLFLFCVVNKNINICLRRQINIKMNSSLRDITTFSFSFYL